MSDDTTTQSPLIAIVDAPPISIDDAPPIQTDKEAFLEKLKLESGAVGNGRLMRLLDWNNLDRYWQAHKELANEGLIVRGRGRGGSVILAANVLPPAEDNASTSPTSIADTQQGSVNDHFHSEQNLYQPARKILEADWVKERNYDNAIVEVTAKAGARASGIWTRPDITIVASKSYPYLPGRSFEIVTFEIKKADAIDVRGVFEALSHRRFATASYVLFYTGKNSSNTSEPNIARVKDLARDHGVGVISAEDINDYDTWEELVEARRNVYNPEEANFFLQTALTEVTRQKIIQWQK